MTPRHEIRSYDYVNHPYEAVRDALTSDPAKVFRTATSAAASRVQAVAAELRLEVGGVKVGTEILLSIGQVQEMEKGTESSRVTRIPIEWEAARRPGLFPLMNAELSVYPLTGTETQLDFRGQYDPPMGLLGDAVDAVVGHRIAEASVQRFIADVARYLRETLT